MSGLSTLEFPVWDEQRKRERPQSPLDTPVVVGIAGPVPDCPLWGARRKRCEAGKGRGCWAGDGTPGAQGLSGLAKAFFYAGSPAVLVSYWPVVSDAAVAITTRMLAEAAKPGVGRAEAHRRAMMAMIDDKHSPHYAHPLFWAPFVVAAPDPSKQAIWPWMRQYVALRGRWVAFPDRAGTLLPLE